MAGTQSQNPEPITVYGLVVPTEWDEEGRPMIVSIASFNEKEYVIDQKASDCLLNSLGKEVLISGVLQEIGKKKFLKHCVILRIKATPL